MKPPPVLFTLYAIGMIGIIAIGAFGIFLAPTFQSKIFFAVIALSFLILLGISAAKDLDSPKG